MGTNDKFGHRPRCFVLRPRLFLVGHNFPLVAPPPQPPDSFKNRVQPHVFARPVPPESRIFDPKFLSALTRRGASVRRFYLFIEHLLPNSPPCVPPAPVPPPPPLIRVLRARLTL